MARINRTALWISQIPEHLDDVDDPESDCLLSEHSSAVQTSSECLLWLNAIGFAYNPPCTHILIYYNVNLYMLIMLSVALSVECIIAHEAWFFSENPSISSGAIRMSDPRDHEDTIIMYAIYMDKYFTNACLYTFM